MLALGSILRNTVTIFLVLPTLAEPVELYAFGLRYQDVVIADETIDWLLERLLS